MSKSVIPAKTLVQLLLPAGRFRPRSRKSRRVRTANPGFPYWPPKLGSMLHAETPAVTTFFSGPRASSRLDGGSPSHEFGGKWRVSAPSCRTRPSFSRSCGIGVRSGSTVDPGSARAGRGVMVDELEQRPAAGASSRSHAVWHDFAGRAGCRLRRTLRQPRTCLCGRSMAQRTGAQMRCFRSGSTHEWKPNSAAVAISLEWSCRGLATRRLRER